MNTWEMDDVCYEETEQDRLDWAIVDASYTDATCERCQASILGNVVDIDSEPDAMREFILGC